MGTIDGPISVPTLSLAFDDLARLRKLSREIASEAVDSLVGYRDTVTGGYHHVLQIDVQEGKGETDQDEATAPSEVGKLSGASTSTVIPFLVRSGRWKESLPPDADPRVAAQEIIDKVIRDPWKSASLPEDNLFTVPFLLELIDTLTEVGAELSSDQLGVCQSKLELLGKALQENGRIQIGGEVPNSYLTDLATRAISAWIQAGRADADSLMPVPLQILVWRAAIASINEELALFATDPSSVDPFELGYSVLLAVEFAGNWTKPQYRRLLRDALGAFFKLQHPDGSWPRSRRLFTYKAYGDAYCYDFEFLARLLRAFSAPGSSSNRNALLPHLEAIQRAITRLTVEAIALPDGGYGWASGHHRSLVYPESWSTASAFDVCDLTDRLVTDTITTTILQYLDQTRLAPTSAVAESVEDEDPDQEDGDEYGLLDSNIEDADGHDHSLQTVLSTELLSRIKSQSQRLAEGKPLEDGTPLSAILYGPPGTSKTSYAKAISRILDWDEIIIDPSHLLKNGIDNIHTEINYLFRMLGYAERVVVFFDEIDELVRERSAQSDELSRFLTTSMLPRIIKLRKSQKLVFLVATNYIDGIDRAFTRPGRFDLVLPVMPPTAEAKLAEWKDVKATLDRLGLSSDDHQLARLGDLTFDEFAPIAKALAGAKTGIEFANILEEAHQNGTMEQEDGDPPRSWRDRMTEARTRIRIRA